jgi:hypothetical protein
MQRTEKDRLANKSCHMDRYILELGADYIDNAVEYSCGALECKDDFNRVS